MIKKISIIMIISAVHFGIVQGITHMSLGASHASFAVTGSVSMWTKILVGVSRVLYFPIITLSLYSRQWFPGDLILIPIGINSLIWGVVVFGIVMLVKKINLKDAKQ